MTNTRAQRNTRKLVQNVRALHDSLPKVVKPILQSIDELSECLIDTIEQMKKVHSQSLGSLDMRGCHSKIGVLINMNHALLASLGVSHPELEKVVALGRIRGFSTKLTGAGGGGCALSLIPFGDNHIQTSEFIETVKSMGMLCFQASIGQNGVNLSAALLPRT